jgi:hypothetical protein
MRRHLGNAGRLRDDQRASPLFSQGILEHRLIQSQVSHQSLQLRVLFLKPLETADLRYPHPGIDLLPAIKVASATPILRQISPTDVPDSACLKANAICSSENRFFGIWVLLSLQRKYPKIRAKSGPIYRVKTSLTRHTRLRHDVRCPLSCQRHHTEKNEAQVEKELMRWSVQEIRRLTLKLAQRQLPVASILKWSTFRRTHQAAARDAHLKKKQL